MQIVLSIVAIIAALVIRSSPADACSPPPDVQLHENGIGLDAVPVAGIVPVFVAVSAEANLTVVVTDPAGLPVPGSFEVHGRTYGDWWPVIEGRLVWRSDAPLVPSTSYTMTITSDGIHNSGPHTVSFTTRAQDELTPPAFVVAGFRLIENIYPSKQVCCDQQIDSCSDQLVDSDCWPTALATSYSLSAQANFFAGAGRYLLLDVSVDGHAQGVSSVGPDFAPVSATFSELGSEHCLEVTATSLLDGTTRTNTTCIPSTALEPDAVPDIYAANVCSDPNPTPLPTSDGCSSTPNPTSMLPFVFAAFLLVRRRRSAKVDSSSNVE